MRVCFELRWGQTEKRTSVKCKLWDHGNEVFVLRDPGNDLQLEFVIRYPLLNRRHSFAEKAG